MANCTKQNVEVHIEIEEQMQLQKHTRITVRVA